MRLEGRELTSSLEFPEGPIAMPDGSVTVVEIAGGRLTRVRPSGELEVVADLGGGVPPNYPICTANGIFTVAGGTRLTG